MRAGVMVLLLVVAALSGCTGGGAGGGEGGEEVPSAGGEEVPVYAGSVPYSGSPLISRIMGVPQGVEVRVYFTREASVREVLEWYKSRLGEYQVGEEPVVTVSTPQGSVEWGAVFFEKDGSGIGVWAYGGSGAGGEGVVYYVARAPLEVLRGEGAAGGEGGGEALPASDVVSGEEPLKRYPGSVMLAYERDAEYPAPGSWLDIEYGTTDSPEEVYGWYRRTLVEEGWSVGRESRSAEYLEGEFSRGAEQLSVSVSPPDGGREYTLISVSYAPNRLPERDRVQGEEVLERYPGSVMLEYASYGAPGGFRVYTATYGTYDGVGEVYSWYQDKLTTLGWQVMEANPGEEAASITAMMPEGRFVRVEIRRYGYTQIQVSVQGAGGG